MYKCLIGLVRFFIWKCEWVNWNKVWNFNVNKIILMSLFMVSKCMWDWLCVYDSEWCVVYIGMI